jgi:hypothetical protein
MSYTKKVLWLVPVTLTVANKTYNAPSGLLPFDTYPGGFYTISFGGLPNSVVNNSFQTFSSNFNIKYRFAFVHTASALCIGGGNQTLTGTQYTARYIGATPPAAPYNTPFQNFTTAFNADGADREFEDDTRRRLNNEPHEHFFIRNANWLAAELNRVDPAPGPASNCTAFCNSLSITGSATLCSSATYSVPAIAGATYTWIAIPSNSATFSGTGNSVTVTKGSSYSGTATIRVIVTISDCGANILDKVVTIGSPSFPYSVTGASPANPNGGYIYSLATTPSDKPVSNIVWTVPSGWSITLGQGTRNLKVRTGTASGNVQVSFDDACGTNWGTYKFVTIGAGGPDPDAVDPGTMSLTVSPNPVSTTLKVSLNNTSNSITAKSITRNMQSIREIIITDPMGSVRKRLHYDSGMQSATIDVAELHYGIYFIRVFDGAGWRYKQVLIAK